MTFTQQYNTNFDAIAEKIYAIGETESTYEVSAPDEISNNISRYSEYGLNSLGKIVGFPADFVREVNESSPALAQNIVGERVKHYFDEERNIFLAREFLGKISGCVSREYAYFDDKSVADIIGNSPLAKKNYAYSLISPERLHLRAIDDEPFRLENDNSDLFFCYFIDNSMVGLSSFKVLFGIYRKACTNGLILPIKEFTLMKQVHRGKKDMYKQFAENVAFLDEKKPDIINILNDLSTAEASIASMQEEHRNSYLARVLNLSKKETEKVVDLYTNTYGGRTKWDLANAITEFARDIKNIERREYLERKALSAAGFKQAA